MKMKFVNKKITGILGLLPEQTFYFDDEVGNYTFPEKQTARLKKVMGYEKHRLAKETSTTSDFCVYGLNYLLNRGRIRKEDIGAIVVITVSPDYFMPHVSNIIHGECDLPEDVLCMDIPQGCCGYLIGLMQSYMLLDQIPQKKVLLFNADVLSHKVSKHDRNDFPLTGDASSISIIENSFQEEEIIYQLNFDGKQREALIIPAGGFAMPCTEETAVIHTMEDGNQRSLNHLRMDGAGVFNFVQANVPRMIIQMLEENGIRQDDVDYYLFHQPNKFMLKKLADKMKVSYDKMFMNIVENFGNPSGASIPINIAYNMGEKLLNNRYLCCLSAFGSGLAWGAMLMQLGDMDFCELIDTDL